MAGKYELLKDYLLEQTSPDFELSFKNIEQIIRDKLPESRVYAQFWANVKNVRSRPQGRAIRDSGHDAFLIFGTDKVRFVKTR